MCENKFLSLNGKCYFDLTRKLIPTASNIEQVQEATPHKAAAVLPPTIHHENYPS